MRIHSQTSSRAFLIALASCLLGACSSLAPGPAVPFPDQVTTSGGGDAEPTGDAATEVPSGPSLNGCAQSSYVDRSGPDDDRTVYFGGSGASGPFSFFPACMVVSPGQTVTWNGDFSVHPLSPGSSPSALTTGTAGTPIPAHATNDSPLAVTFGTGGTFPFFCQNHYASGMYGAVRVR